MTRYSRTAALTLVALAAGLATQAFAQTYEYRQTRKGLSVQETPKLALSASALAFPDQAIGTTSSALSLAVLNSRNTNATLTGISVTGPFEVSSTCNGIVPANDACTVSVVFRPTEVASSAGELTLTSNVGTFTATLTGTGTAGAPLWTVQSVSGTSFNAQFAPATTTQSQTLTVRNAGTGAAFSLPAIAMMGEAAADYSASSTCQNVAPGQTCTVTVSFDAQGPGTRTASLTLGTTTTTFTGYGYDFTVSPTSLSFPDTSANSTSTGQVVTLSNPYTVDVPLSTRTTASPFSVASSTCGASLAAGTSCTATVTFRPTAIQAYTGSLTLAVSGGSKQVSLAGTGVDGVPVWTLTANSGTVFSAQDVASTTAATQTVTVKNAGTGVAKPLPTPTISGPAAGDFSVSSNCSSVAVNATCTVTVSFDAKDAGERVATVNIGGTDLTYTGYGYTGVTTFSYTGAIQTYTVPETGTYHIEAIGAQGGSATTYSARAGAKGAQVVCSVALTAGQSLKILVGGQGSAGAQYGGGGGGSFVALSDNTPVCVAGGGGGGRYTNATSSPGAGFLGGAGIGGTSTGGNSASGGGGYYTNGTASNLRAGVAFVNGGAGGAADTCSGNGGSTAGGYGGGSAGGCGNWSGGNGGGWNGGNNSGEGGGGSSYTAGTGSYTVTTRTGAGQVRVLR